MGKCPHGLGENRGGRVGGGAENVHRGCPTGPQEVVLGFRVFEGQVITPLGGWSPAGVELVFSLHQAPCLGGVLRVSAS